MSEEELTAQRQEWIGKLKKAMLRLGIINCDSATTVLGEAGYCHKELQALDNPDVIKEDEIADVCKMFDTLGKEVEQIQVQYIKITSLLRLIVCALSLLTESTGENEY